MSMHEHAAVFARIDALPTRYRTQLLAAVDRLLETYAHLAGVEVPDDPLTAKVVLRLVPPAVTGQPD